MVNLGRIWVGLAVVATGVVVALLEEQLKPATANSDILERALMQLGVLYVLALFVERALEVFVKAWRQARRTVLESELAALDKDGGEWLRKRGELEAYRTGTRRRALLLALTFGIFLSLAGVRTLGVLFGQPEGELQAVAFLFSDVLVTAGLIAGGSSAVHELMSLITGFLAASRQSVKR